MDLRPLLGAALLAAAMPAPADDAAGIVKRLQGAATLQRGGQTLPLAPGTAVRVGDRIVTGAGAAVGITLADDTLLTAGPASVLLLNEFRFDATTHEGALLASLLKGQLLVVTGLIARQTPQNVNVQTRSALIGVRGTEFIVDTRGGEP